MVPRRRRPPPSVFIFPRFLHSSNPRSLRSPAKFPNHRPPPNPRTAPPRDSGARFTGEMPPRRRSAKRRRGRATEAAAAEADADALISLPTEVLDDILARLGIRDAVRTSALSRAWRHRWEALPSLDLVFLPRDGEFASEGLGAVDGILLRFPGRIRRFYAHLDETYVGRIYDWLHVLSRRGVEVLDLCFDDGFPALPSSVFSCSRLTSLSLIGGAIPLLPMGFLGFPELRSLSLVCVKLQEFGEYQLEEMIEKSPLLEHLDLTDVSIVGAYARKWAVRAPNLRHLTICSENDDGWILKKLTSLSTAEICFCFSDNLVQHFLVHRNLAKFLSGLVQVQELILGMCNIPSSAKMPEMLLSTFHNLKNLKLLIHFCQQPPIMLMLCLLKSAPNLEKLKIEIFDEQEEQEFEANGEFLNALWTDGMCANLQVVEVIHVKWRPNEMSFIELILSKARLLHTLSISHNEKIVMSNEDALNELLRYRRASDEAQVLFKGKAENYYCPR